MADKQLDEPTLDTTPTHVRVKRACTFVCGDQTARLGQCLTVPRHVYEENTQALELAPEPEDEPTPDPVEEEGEGAEGEPAPTLEDPELMDADAR